MEPPVELSNKLKEYGQEHLLEFWSELDEASRKHLLDDLMGIDFKEVTSYFTRVNEQDETRSKLDDKILPLPEEDLGSYVRSTVDKLREYEELGLREIADGKVAVLLMAGGQGTRLGVTYPKGMYDVGLPSHKTLFQLQAERILRMQNLAKERCGENGEIKWYIMTSEATYDETLKFLRKNNFFNLKESNIKIFEQGLLPCFKFDGKIILDNKHRVAKAPDGNGGLYRSLKVEGIIDDMTRRGVRSIHVHSVDNSLVRVADPIFLGYCLSRQAECGAKSCEKSSPSEAVGVICQVEGTYQVVEYSEISQKTTELRRDDGSLLFGAGNICNHYFTLDFVRKIAEKHEQELDLHMAKKKIPCVNAEGKRVVPDKPNGIKMEKFVFDVFKFAKKLIVWDVPRESEFSPVKNSDSAGKDCPKVALRDVLALHKSWLLKAGAAAVVGDVEVSPLRSYAGEDLTVIAKGQTFQGPLVL